MKVTAIKITLYADWVKSLKEKRAEVKRIISAIQNKFHCSVTEAAAQDVHKTIVIGIAYAAGDIALSDSQKESIIAFTECIARAEVTGVIADTWNFD